MMTSNLRFSFEQYLSSKQPWSPPRFRLLSISFQFLWIPALHPYLCPVFADLACLFLILLVPAQMLCSKPRIFPLLFVFPSALSELPHPPSHLGTLIVSASLLLIWYLLVSWPLLAHLRVHLSLHAVQAGVLRFPHPPIYHLSFHPVYLAALFHHGMPSAAPISWGKCWSPFRMCVG